MKSALLGQNVWITITGSTRQHHNFSTTSLNLDTIVQEMNFLDKNKTNLVNVVEQNILEPLKKGQLIISYEETDGLSDIKYVIKLPKKKLKGPHEDL